MQTETLVFKNYQITVYRKPRQKKVYLYVKPGGQIIVSAAKSISVRTIKNFLLTQEDWLQKSLDKMQSVKDPRTLEIHDGMSVPFKGEWHKLSVVESKKNHVFLTVKDAQKIICIHAKKTDPQNLKKLLLQFYRDCAEGLFATLMTKLCSHLQLTVTRVRVANQRTRWGSCSSRGVISLNVKLMGAPVDSMIYVLVHEVCHLVHKNHGPEFWGMVQKIMPNYRVHQKWLSENSRFLDFLNKI